jgi:alanyl-tRNA synthetase
VLQGVISNYETDLFRPLIREAEKLTSYDSSNRSVASDNPEASLRIIADHSRAATFLISDGVLPSNEGRGYVLRKIIRRAITHGRLLGQTKPFLNEMVFAVRNLMQSAYPELNETADRVSKAILAEETRFLHTIDAGLHMLAKELSELDIKQSEPLRKLPGIVVPTEPLVLPGAIAFKLYDTFGLPLDFIEDVLRDRGAYLDKKGFQAAMEEQ